jgi:SOS-response transcriptional repressor LexA
MTPKQSCDDWINYAYENWLVAWIRKLPESSYLSPSSQNMINRMKSAADKNNTEEAWNLLERLKRLSDTFYGVGKGQPISEYQDERSEVYMECALVAYDMGDLEESKKLFQVAIDGYLGRNLHKAVSYWLLGCVQWQLPAHFEAAVVSWERCLKILNDADLLEQERSKRSQVSTHMRDAINRATVDGYPHPPMSDSPFSSGANSNPRTKGQDASRASYAFSTQFKFLPYFGSIPAGDPVSALQVPDGEVGVESLRIDGRLYRIVGVKYEREIRVSRGSDYFLMKAVGNSMNNAGPVNIENGDYVLLKNTQQAVSNDIVAAVVFGPGEPETATLKRYHEDGGGRFLMSESLTETINIRMSGSDYVQGVALAVLKPTND